MIVTSQFIEQARKMVAIDSSPGESSVPLASYCQSIAKELGLDCDLQTEIFNGIPQANLIVRCQKSDLSLNNFLLQAHLDTLEPGNYSTWQKNNFNPFNAVIEDDVIYGLGVAKSKTDLLVKLHVLSQFKERPIKNLQPLIVATFGEQSGMQGLLKLIRQGKIVAKYALVSEPTNLNLITASKGFALVEIKIPFSKQENEFRQKKILSESTSTQTRVFSGLSSHSSEAHKGESAAKKLFEYLAKLPENVGVIEIDCGTRMSTIPNQAMIEIDSTLLIEDSMAQKLNAIYRTIQHVELAMQQIKDIEFEPQNSTLSIGIIRSDDHFVRIGGSCRIVPQVRQENYEEWITYLKNEFEKIGAEFKVVDYKKPFRIEKDAVFVKTAMSELESLIGTPIVRTVASTNEASLLSRRGIDCLCIGAGLRADHRQQTPECVKLKDIEIIASFYSRMIERYCL